MSKPAELIFETLIQKGPLTIPQLSRMLHLTRADIRHHLNELISEGRVVKTLTSTNQVGRPAHAYQAIRPLNRTWVQTLVKNQSHLLHSLGLSEEELTVQIADSILADFAPTGHPTAKLNQAVTFLHAKGIEAKWIAGPDGPLISLTETDFLDAYLSEALIAKIQKEL